ncbi:hypothetical protein ESCO_005059 [Escovopsis weberi]|uniref:Calcofluor white hypersensitive protein n=1 Tax=Escovopsis weberi TaxID=150374 RepID=A0A0M9VVX6_ESCWE|nr:hypothetical protein ESCO_005059 [Escovopsis weberi]
MSKSRMPVILGGAAVGAMGYYLYRAGGDTKQAGKKFESDLDKAAGRTNITTDQPASKAHKEVKGYSQEAGAKIDNTISEVDKQAGKLKSGVESYAKDAKNEAARSVDRFDNKVEEGAAKAKGGLSGWFGGGSGRAGGGSK